MKMRNSIPLSVPLSIAISIAMTCSAYAQDVAFKAIFTDTYNELCGIDNEEEGCAEITALDADSLRLFTVNAEENQLRVLDMNDIGQLKNVGFLDLSEFGAEPNSVAVLNGIVAVAIEADTNTQDGQVVFFDSKRFQLLSQVPVGASPDMLTYTPDGNYLLVANEGEPSDDYLIDPVGSVTVIDTLDYSTRTAGFESFAKFDDSSIRVFGPGATVAQDLEPEFIAVSADSTTAWISLQENNAIAALDVASATITSVRGLGFKNHAQPRAAFDASNRDGGESCAIPLEDPEQCINIEPWSTSGMYQPDGIAFYMVDGESYIVSANEGDARDYDGFSEEARIGDDEFILDPIAFPDADVLEEDSKLGRLMTTLSTGDADGDGDFDTIFSYGGRSFSIWDAYGNLIYDSGSDFETRLAELQQSGIDVWTDNRSDDKGPEPESVAIGKLAGKPVGFIGLERTSGIFAYDLSDPKAPAFLGYINIKAAGDISPEGLVFRAIDENNGLLIVTSEVSNTISTYRIMLSETGISHAPVVTAGLITFNGEGYWQVQTSDSFTSICEGMDITSCEVKSGIYNVINLTTGQRFENINVES